MNGPYAYITLVMNGDRYVAGAAVLGQRLKELQAKEHLTCQQRTALYCMITHDVTLAARNILAMCFDEVLEVPYIRATTQSLLTLRQKQLYESWINASFTKWNIFNPAIFTSRNLTIPEKVLFLDSDMLPLQPIHNLFQEVETPAACFSNWMSEIFVKQGGIREIYEKPRRLTHGEAIPIHEIGLSLNIKREPRTQQDQKLFTFAVNGAMVLIQPSSETFQYMLHILKTYHQQRLPYGFPGVYSGFDEQMLCQLFLFLHSQYGDLPKHISPGYVWNAGKFFWVPHVLDRKVIHFYGDQKPWFIPRQKQYKDTKEWWKVAQEVSVVCAERGLDFDAFLPNSLCE